jgi:hypothetical protein
LERSKKQRLCPPGKTTIERFEPAVLAVALVMLRARITGAMVTPSLWLDRMQPRFSQGWFAWSWAAKTF